jgi:hypothetical protein
MIGLLSLLAVDKTTSVATWRWKHYWISTEMVMVSLVPSSPCGALPTSGDLPAGNFCKVVRAKKPAK